MIAVIMAVGVMICGVAQAASVKATLGGVKGSVEVQKAAGGGWEAGANGLLLGEGAAVKTGPGAEAVLAWGGHAVKIAALSLVKVATLTGDDKGGSVSKLSLEQGRVTARVAKLTTKESQFTVKTPTAIAGVRGTAFDFAINPANNATTLAVVEGSVSLAAGAAEVVVEQGFESAVAPGEAPSEPIEIPAERMEELKSSVTDLKETAAAVESAAPAAAAKEEAPAAPAEVDEAKVIETTQDNAVEQDTIQNAINEAAQNVCPGTGGCIEGTIELFNY